MEGFCHVNVKIAPRRRATMPELMERYRPLTAHEKKMHRLKTAPRAYEYLPLPQPMQEAQKQAMESGEEHEQAGLGIFFLAMLDRLLRLPEVEEFSRGELGNTNTP